jgi:hypothetical protein
MPTKAGTLAKVVKPATACRKANYSRDTNYIRNDSNRDVNSSRTARISRKQQQAINTRTLETAAETTGTSQMSTAEG